MDNKIRVLMGFVVCGQQNFGDRQQVSSIVLRLNPFPTCALSEKFSLALSVKKRYHI